MSFSWMVKPENVGCTLRMHSILHIFLVCILHRIYVMQTEVAEMHILYQFPVDWIPQQCSKLTHLLLHQNLPVDFYHQFAFSYNSIQPLTIPATHDARTHKLLIPKYAICKLCILRINVECICIAYCIFKNECILHCIGIYACQKDCIYAIFAYAYMHTNHSLFR